MVSLIEGNMGKFGANNNANPRGRPANALALSKFIRDEGDQLVMYKDDDGVITRMPKIEAVVKKLYSMALEGNLMAVNTLLDRIMGKPFISAEIITPPEKRFPPEFYEALRPQIKEAMKE